MFSKTKHLQSSPLQGPRHKCLDLNPEPSENHRSVHMALPEHHNVLVNQARHARCLLSLGGVPSQEALGC